MIMLTYFLGFISGMVGMTVFALYASKKYAKTRDTKKSLSDRMKRVKEISVEQLDLASRAEGPQKNALDGKYKNTLIDELKALDEERNSILVSILKDGHDPELTTMDSSGTVSQMKLSEYLAYLGVDLGSKSNDTSKAEKHHKFMVYKGGKDDGNNTTH